MCCSNLFQALRCLNCFSYVTYVVIPDIFPRFLFYGITYLHISYVFSGGIISLRFFIRALVGDDMFGFFCLLVCFAMLIALCWIISVMFIFRLSMPSCSSSAVTFFLVQVKRVHLFFPIILVLTLVPLFLSRSFLLSALVFNVIEPITICGHFQC